MTLGLLLYCWKRDDKFKRIIHAVCEYACLVRSVFQVDLCFFISALFSFCYGIAKRAISVKSCFYEHLLTCIAEPEVADV